MSSITIRQAVLADLNAVAILFDGYRQFYGQASDEAAAKALEYRFLEVGEFIIVGHDSAMQYIPENLRFGVNI